jgi:pimeloyl-ACP methyl ester carboxylesterase
MHTLTDVHPSTEISPYDRMFWSDKELLACLASGARHRELVLYFGSDSYLELRQLAQQAASSAPRANTPIVWLLPGIMGSQLGIEREDGLPPDILWLDALDIIQGQLSKLRFYPGSPVKALGVLHFSYLRLQLRLQIAGFATRCFAYDWRQDVRHSAAALAAALRHDGRRAALVAHSLGGLVARCALAEAALPPIDRVILLGTPNNGAWGAVQALRGSYPVVRHLAQLDLTHDAETLAAEVFGSFESLYQLLPAVAHDNSNGRVDFLDASHWPRSGVVPSAARFALASELRLRLPAIDSRYVAIYGSGHPTCFGARSDGEQWHYELTTCGDGTVTERSACPAGITCYRTETGHSELPKEPRVAQAIAEILHSGKTTQLALRSPQQPDAAVDGPSVSDHLLARRASGKLDWAAMSIDARRVFLENLNTPLGQEPSRANLT